LSWCFLTFHFLRTPQLITENSSFPIDRCASFTPNRSKPGEAEFGSSMISVTLSAQRSLTLRSWASHLLDGWSRILQVSWISSNCHIPVVRGPEVASHMCMNVRDLFVYSRCLTYPFSPGRVQHAKFVLLSPFIHNPFSFLFLERKYSATQRNSALDSQSVRSSFLSRLLDPTSTVTCPVFDRAIDSTFFYPPVLILSFC
jgi:hypothetical protein